MEAFWFLYFAWLIIMMIIVILVHRYHLGVLVLLLFGDTELVIGNWQLGNAKHAIGNKQDKNQTRVN